jgi:hypothetical protein
MARVSALKSCPASRDLNVKVLSPELPNVPKGAVELLDFLINTELKNTDAVALVGHSLGGYFGTYLAQKHDLKIALVNPVIRGYEIMCEFFGECYNPHTGERFSIGEDDIEFLININVDQINHKENFLLIQQLRDNVTTPVETIELYRGCPSILEDGGSHDYDGFPVIADRVIDFLFRS